MINSKNKGGSFERSICKKLSLWWSNGDDPDIFWRSASSGGRATQKNLEVHRGDITNIEGKGLDFIHTFVVECKFYKEIDILRVLDGNKLSWMTWWSQVEFDAKASLRHPMLIMKRNRKHPYIVLRYEDYKIIKENQCTEALDMVYLKVGDIIILSLSDFLVSIQPEDIKILKTPTFKVAEAVLKDT